MPTFPQTSIDWTKKLIGFDTTSRYSNLELIEYINAYLSRCGVESFLVFNEDGKKANLFGTIPSVTGERLKGGLVLSGHTDVVPVDGQDWNSEPFVAKEHEGRLYGRGACDMKGFIGTVLALVPEFTKARLKAPLHLAFSFDEEIGCLGAPLLLKELAQKGIKPAGCIVGEPTSMRPVVAHKGISAYKCIVHGCAAHSSLTPVGINAIEYAARIICMFRDLTDEIKQKGPFDEYFDVPFTTGQTSTIQGGNAINTVPAHCEFLFEYRTLPAQSPTEILARIESYINDVLVPQMKKENPDAGIELIKLAGAPGMETAEKEAIMQLVRGLTKETDIAKVAYATEGGLFQQAGIPTVICGPGSIEQAHKANEYIALEQLAKCEAFLKSVCASQQVA
ncbi:acetylornithine deacetylase [Advenella sp. WQ 585]|uniref:Acetylornithine deacetylase n=1 Tax=Advenella mandrilli TaxID=2800330 RepID=A0ABS1EGH7_9BURK|nr:acetylornithine deacetylase [Advenella mandrilli]MBK1782108.1 acetylornithine deacetylase [Advenella mandrilli]